MFKTIFDKLEAHKLNPYPVATHQGDCLEPYVVIREGTQSTYVGAANKLGYRIVDLILFVPASDYTAMKEYAKEVRDALKELPNVRKTGMETPAIPDDGKKAITMSIEYQLIKRLEG